jgi:hypothetical protein
VSLKEAREALAEQLNTALPAHEFYPYVPSQLDAGEGAGALEPSEDYVVRGDTFSLTEVMQSLDLWLFVAYPGDNESAADALDEFLTAVLPALGEWAVTRTGKPGPQTNGEWLAHGVRLTVTNYTNL